MRQIAPFSNEFTCERLTLKSLDHTARLGQCLARAIVESEHPGALLLYGTLGAGKTTLCGSLVSALPGGEEAETGSPSFTICNIYCTQPVVHHFDLYRLVPGTHDEGLEESFESDTVLTIVEWPEHISPPDLPVDGLALRLTPGNFGPERTADFSPLGELGEKFLGRVLSYYRHL